MSYGVTGLGVGLGVGAAAAVGIGTYVLGSKITDGIAKDNPTGSGADGPARATAWGLGLLGAIGIVGGVVLGNRNANAGAALIGAGVGGVLGAIGTGIGFGVKHGIGIETEANDVFNAYNRDFDDKLDLEPGWRTPEFVRREEDRHYDSDGNYLYSTYDYYDISRLTERANTNHDGVVTREEMHAALRSWDDNGDGRLQGHERNSYESQAGERAWWGNWIN